MGKNGKGFVIRFEGSKTALTNALASFRQKVKKLMEEGLFHQPIKQIVLLSEDGTQIPGTTLKFYRPKDAAINQHYIYISFQNVVAFETLKNKVCSDLKFEVMESENFRNLEKIHSIPHPSLYNIQDFQNFILSSLQELLTNTSILAKIQDKTIQSKDVQPNEKTAKKTNQRMPLHFVEMAPVKKLKTSKSASLEILKEQLLPLLATKLPPQKVIESSGLSKEQLRSSDIQQLVCLNKGERWFNKWLRIIK